MAVAGGDVPDEATFAEAMLKESGQNITHQKSQKWSSMGKCHWKFIATFQWKSTGKWQSFRKYRWKVKSCWKMPLKVHDDFWGVDFWGAIYCPSRSSRRPRVARAVASSVGGVGPEDRRAPSGPHPHLSRGSHLSNTTCQARVFFKSGEWCSKLN